MERVYAVNPAEVQRIAVEYLRPDEMAIAVAGDLATIRDQLTPFGEIVETRGA